MGGSFVLVLVVISWLSTPAFPELRLPYARNGEAIVFETLEACQAVLGSEEAKLSAGKVLTDMVMEFGPVKWSNTCEPSPEPVELDEGKFLREMLMQGGLGRVACNMAPEVCRAVQKGR